jgi:transcriptional regulator of NAD metabolism
VDQLNVEKKGIPTVTIATTPFEEPAKAVAEAQGVSDFSLVVVEHPIAGHDADGIKAKAEEEFNVIFEAATQWQPK